MVSKLAHDSMLGRAVPSPEVEYTASFVAGQMQAFGLKPLGDAGSYLQRFPLNEVRWDLEESGLTIGGQHLRLGESAQLIGTGGAPPEVATGTLVYLSGALRSASSVELMDLADKVVMFYYPTGPEGEFAAGFDELAGAMFSKRAAAVVVITDRSERHFSSAANSLSETTIQPGWDATGDSGRGMAILEIRRNEVGEILAGFGIEMDDMILDLSGPPSRMTVPEARVSVTMKRTVVQRLSSPNVVSYIEGRDSTVQGEYVVYIAHMDGTGFSTPDALGDSIFNSADDNASGTAALLSIARGFAVLDMAPRRSVLFIATSSGREGSWGGQYFIDNSPVTSDAMVAALNADMIGRAWSEDTLALVGGDFSEIGEIVDSVLVARRGLNLTSTFHLWPEQNYFYRSDHLPFARAGIPSVMFFTSGPNDRWRRRSDHSETLDYHLTARVAKLMMSTGIAIANGKRRPLWYPNKFSEVVALR